MELEKVLLKDLDKILNDNHSRYGYHPAKGNRPEIEPHPLFRALSRAIVKYRKAKYDA